MRRDKARRETVDGKQFASRLPTRSCCAIWQSPDSRTRFSQSPPKTPSLRPQHTGSPETSICQTVLQGHAGLPERSRRVGAGMERRRKTLRRRRSPSVSSALSSNAARARGALALPSQPSQRIRATCTYSRTTRRWWRPPPFSATLRAHAAARFPSRRTPPRDERRSLTLLRVFEIFCASNFTLTTPSFHAFRHFFDPISTFDPLVHLESRPFDGLITPLVASQSPSPHYALILRPGLFFIPSASSTSAWTRGPWLRS